MFLCNKCRERLSYSVDFQGNDGSPCELCSNLLEHVEDFYEMFREEAKQYSFSTFLIGLKAQRENLRRDLEEIEKSGSRARNYKEEFQFRLGTKIENDLPYRVDFSRPEFIFTVNQETMDYSIRVRSVYIKGKYLKKRRGIPQSPWIKPGKGKELEKSVSEYIGQPVCEAFEGGNYNFFASGREDVDALMLGTGRPFYVEVKSPRKRDADMSDLSRRVLVGSRDGVEVLDLSLAEPSEIETMKNQKPDKTYEVGLTIDGRDITNLEEKLVHYSNVKISQRTPSRVLGVRKDKLRERIVRSVEVKEIRGNQVVLIIRAEAGTYIKEFVTGDNGRTVPNLKDELDINVKIDYLNVLEVK